MLSIPLNLSATSLSVGRMDSKQPNNYKICLVFIFKYAKTNKTRPIQVRSRSIEMIVNEEEVV